MPLINMIRSAEEVKDDNCGMCCTSDEEAPKPEYPYGLRLCLGSPELEKLSMGLVAVGTEMTVTAKVKVVEARQEANEQSERRNMDLQITDMEIVTAPAPINAKAIYPNSNMS
jgi:hypothetical protein